MMSLRTLAAWMLLLAFVAGGLVGPHVHQAVHVVEEAAAAAEVEACTSRAHTTDVPLVTADEHAVDGPSCTLCATHHLLSAVLNAPGVVVDVPQRMSPTAPPAHVRAGVEDVVSIRGPPSRA